uniref:Putative replicase n=1 Tax=Grapevine virus A TaxID=35288 RepID=Q06IY2_9VIRU|nr:putative replicase [Grapevine virus A]
MSISVSSQRVAASNLFTNGAEEQIKAIKELKSKRLLETELGLDGLFDYFIPDTVREILTGYGMEFSVHSFQGHAHPISKMIENHMLYRIAPHYFSDRTLIISCKESKVKRLKISNKNRNFNFAQYNRLVHAKDHHRYENATRDLDVGSLCGVINLEKTCECVFIHDEVQYWSLDEMQRFLGSLEHANRVVYSIVYPAEVDAGFNQSLFPEAYTFDLRDGRLTWYPDGKAEGAYTQPVNPWLLGCSKTIDSKSRSWTITKLQTVGAHHIFSAVLGSFLTEDSYKYDNFTVINPNDILRGRRGCKPLYLRARMIRPTLLYLCALKKADSNSAVAKLRMLSNREENMDEALFVAQLAKQIKDTGLYDRMGNPSIKSLLSEAFHDIAGNLFTRLFNKPEYDARCLEKFIRACETTEFYIPRKFMERVYRGSSLMVQRVVDWVEDEEANALDEVNLQELCKNDRNPEPYGALVLNGDNRRAYVPITRIMRSHALILESARSVEINRVVVVCSARSLLNLRMFLIRLGRFRYMESRGLTDVQDMQEALEDGLLSEEEVEARLFTSQDTESEGSTSEETGHIVDEPRNDEAGTPRFSKVRNLIKEGIFTEQLKGREVAFYSRYSKDYKYAGGHHRSLGWDDALDALIAELGLDESYDHCLIQRYMKDGAIGFHADDEPCYLPGGSVVTVNLNGEALFEVKENSSGVIKKIHMKDGDVYTMGPGMQQTHKHRVQSLSDGRCSITLRDKTVDYEAQRKEGSSEYEEDIADADEGIEYLKRNSANMCSLKAIAEHMQLSIPTVVSIVNGESPQTLKEIESGGVSVATLVSLSRTLGFPIALHGNRGFAQTQGDYRKLHLRVGDGHVEPFEGVASSGGLREALLLSDGIGQGIFRVDKVKADRLAQSFYSGCTGVLLGKYNKGKMHAAELEEPTEVLTSFGFAGSGKSHWCQTILRSCDVEKTLVISPRKVLKDDWAGKISKKHKVVTFEVAFMDDFGCKAIVIDEIGLLPPGYIDLVISVFHPNTLVLLGDPLQSSYHSKRDNVILEASQEDIFNRIKGALPYLCYSHRPPKNCKIFEIECMGGEAEKRITFRSKRGKDEPVICATRAMREMNGSGWYTVSETQGLSFKTCMIQLCEHWAKKNDEDVMVAFTRSRGEIAISVDRKLKEVLLRTSKSELLRKILSGETYRRSSIIALVKKHIPEALIVFEENRLASNVDYEERLAGDPYLKSLLSLYEDIEEEEVEIEEPVALEPIRTHLPLSEKLNELIPFDLKAKEDREQYTEAGRTEQIDEEGYGQWGANPMTHKALYLRHTSDDTATFMMSVKKRLRYRSYEGNRRKYLSCHGIGRQMFSVLKETYQWKDIESLPELEKCEKEFMRKRVEKSAALIEQHSGRSDPDWPSNYLKIFLKQQTCTKMEKRGVDAKAGQTIACFAHSVLCRFGPLLRQTEKAFRELLPENVMIYSQKNYMDLDKWSKTWVEGMLGTDSDYEAFDRSQDEKILDMEIEVLRFFLWPEEMIQEYETLKLMMGSALGDLAIMRFSGEFGTFFFNTLSNMVFSCMRYHLDKNTPICFAGDDMYSPGVLQVRKDYEKTLEELTLKAKVHVSEEPLFCGWRMSPYGIIKEPNLILDRWKIAQRSGNLDLCIVNYAIEASFGYRLSEYLYDVNIDVDAQQELIREIVEHKHKLPKKIAGLFSDDECEAHSDGDDDFLLNDVGREYRIA